MKLSASIARADTRLVIADALQKKLARLREQQAACDAERSAVATELLALALEVGGNEDAAGSGDPARNVADAAVAEQAAPTAPSPVAARPRAPVQSVTFRDVSHLPAEARGDTLTAEADEVVVAHISTAWKVCGALACQLGCIALGAENEQAVFVSHERGQSWTSQIPPLALAAVQVRVGGSTEERTASEQRVAFVAFGTDDRYYVRWESGLHDWIADERCSAEIKKRPVAQLAFGADWPSYLIIFKDGGISYAQLPPACERALRARATPASARLRDAALGPSGEWWLSFRDGSSASGGLPDGLKRAIESHEAAGNEVTSLCFGVGGTWVLRTSERSSAVQRLLRCS